MKNLFFNSLLTVGLILCLSACITQPEFDNTPKITFNNVTFVRSALNAGEVTFSFSFEDGDGDLGIYGTETAPPYHARDLFLVSNGEKFPFTDKDDVDRDKDLFLDINSNDTMPDYNCEIYYLYDYLNPIDSTFLTDTLYAVFNPLRNNFFIDFLIKDQVSGEFSIHNFSNSCNSTFDARFYPLFEDINDLRPISGVMNRKISFLGGIREVYEREEIFKIQVYILDRAGNKSNVIESFEFTFKQIEVK